MSNIRFITSVILILWCFLSEANEEPRRIHYQYLDSEKPLPDFVPASFFKNQEKLETKNLEKHTSLVPMLGRFKIESIENSAQFKALQDKYQIAKNSRQKIQQLPMIEFDFVNDGGYLIPNKRTLQRSDHPYWEWQISPGQYWQPADNNKLTRIVFPFSLQEKNANCTHNGLLLFLMNKKGETTKGIFQIASETCAYFQFDLVGRITVDYDHHFTSDEKAIKELFRLELSNKQAASSIKDLLIEHPKIKLKKILPRDLSSSTTSGLVLNGKHYPLNCDTRYGEYPYCRWLALPSFSTAKSIFAGIGLMRLQALIPKVGNVLVNKIIPECSLEKWNKVTLSDLINMRTGNYLSSNGHGDEASKRMIDFLISSTHKERLEQACNMFPHKAIPSKHFKYHTSDTYLAGVMLDRILKKVSGETNFYRNILVQDLWKRLNLSPLLNESKRSYDEAEQNLTGWGLTYYAGDIIKIVKFLHEQKHFKGNNLLDVNLLNSALQFGENRLNLSGGAENMAYNNGFWGLEISRDIGCKKPTWIPFMSGFGGISIVLISDNVLYYNFSDNYQFLWIDAVKELSRHFSLCEINQL